MTGTGALFQWNYFHEADFLKVRRRFVLMSACARRCGAASVRLMHVEGRLYDIIALLNGNDNAIKSTANAH